MDITTGQLVLILIFAVCVALSLAWVLSAKPEPRYIDGKVREISTEVHVDEYV